MFRPYVLSLTALALTQATNALTISLADLGSIDFSTTANPDIQIVHGTDLTDPNVQAAMNEKIGIFFTTTGTRRIVGYDTEAVGGLDPDLERLSNDPVGPADSWAGGNLDPMKVLGIIAIAQNIGTDNVPGDYVSNTSSGPVFGAPNDNASGGTFTYNLKASLGIQQFVASVIDAEAGTPGVYTVTVNGIYTVDLVQNAIDQGLNPVYGGRTLNSLGTVNLFKISGGAETVITQIDYVINGDSGGTGGFLFDTVPEPSTALLSLLGGLAMLRRRR